MDGMLNKVPASGGRYMGVPHYLHTWANPTTKLYMYLYILKTYTKDTMFVTY